MHRARRSNLSTAQAFWGAKAAEYEGFIRRVVPRYDEMIERLLDYMPANAGRVLELGCGTGNLSLALLERLPSAVLTCVDAAPEMIEITRSRLAERLGEGVRRVRFVAARFEDLQVEPDAYDLIVASLSLHHVGDIAAVYRKLRPGMTAGAALRIADGYAGATSALHDVHWARWQAFWREPGNLDEEEIQIVLDHAHEHDHYLRITEHFQLLAESGFADCDCVWRDGLFAVVTAEAV